MAQGNHLAKLFVASLFAIPLAALSGAQALSSASLRNSPELAASVFPYNGIALERLAHRAFVTDVEETLLREQKQTIDALDDIDRQAEIQVEVAELQSFARRASKTAKRSLLLEPLATKARVLLAISEEDPDRKREIVNLASELNRRDLGLQALVLQQSIDDQDYQGLIETLDQILRVNPEQQARFFPLLVDAMANEKTVGLFEQLLSQPLPWRDSFLSFAVGNQKVLERLALIRERVAVDNRDFDKRLIAGLAGNGELEAAERVYRQVTRRSEGVENNAAWMSDYPPFDWQLADEPGFRAQVSRRSSDLEIEVDPGNGGVLASRLLPNPGEALTFILDHEIYPAAQLEDVSISLACWGAGQPFLEQTLKPGRNSFSVSDVPDCDFLEVAIRARAWTGGRALSGTIKPLSL